MTKLLSLDVVSSSWVDKSSNSYFKGALCNILDKHVDSTKYGLHGQVDYFCSRISKNSFGCGLKLFKSLISLPLDISMVTSGELWAHLWKSEPS